MHGHENNDGLRPVLSHFEETFGPPCYADERGAGRPELQQLRKIRGRWSLISWGYVARAKII